MALERIQKIISTGGYCSRRKAEELIRQGIVTVNGRPAKIGDSADPLRDIIAVDGEKIIINAKKEKLYVMLYKPRGYVTTMSDELGRKCVTELVSDLPDRVYPIGRLDKNSEGLLLLTNDGKFANMIMHPSGGIKKHYRVTVREKVTEEQIIALSLGVEIDGKKTAPCTIHVISADPNRTVMEFILSEGRNREIRKMCETQGLTVVRLKRFAEGAVKLGMLKPGEYRLLKKEEVAALRAAAIKGIAKSDTENRKEK
ncbi:MAG: rRNA pseudouridine synthase [Oscillospiraceae bacterium]|nr:rRNA pseudouridine synthase [Oscillospiraceae bacterium]